MFSTNLGHVLAWSIVMHSIQYCGEGQTLDSRKTRFQKAGFQKARFQKGRIPEKPIPEKVLRGEPNARTPEVAAARRQGQTQREANARTPEVTAARRLGQTQREANDRHPRE